MRLLILIALILVGCSEERKPLEMVLSVPSDTPAADIEKIQQAGDLLSRRCPGVKKYWSDLKQENISIANANGYSEKSNFGWNEFVEIELVVVDRPESIPSTYKSMGNHCYFRINTTKEPWVDVSKKACQSICQDRVIQP